MSSPYGLSSQGNQGQSSQIDYYFAVCENAKEFNEKSGQLQSKVYGLCQDVLLKKSNEKDVKESAETIEKKLKEIENTVDLMTSFLLNNIKYAVKADDLLYPLKNAKNSLTELYNNLPKENKNITKVFLDRVLKLNTSIDETTKVAAAKIEVALQSSEMSVTLPKEGRISSLRKDKESADIVIICKNGARVYAHSLLLNQLPYFKDGNFKVQKEQKDQKDQKSQIEAKQDKENQVKPQERREINLTDFSSEVVEEMLDKLYGVPIENKSKNEKELAELADYLALEDLAPLQLSEKDLEGDLIVACKDGELQVHPLVFKNVFLDEKGLAQLKNYKGKHIEMLMKLLVTGNIKTSSVEDLMWVCRMAEELNLTTVKTKVLRSLQKYHWEHPLEFANTLLTYFSTISPKDAIPNIKESAEKEKLENSLLKLLSKEPQWGHDEYFEELYLQVKKQIQLADTLENFICNLEVFEDSRIPEKKQEELLKILKVRAKGGNIAAGIALARSYLNGFPNNPESFLKAQCILEELSKRGSANAKYFLKNLTGFKLDGDESASLLHEAIAKGNLSAFCEMLDSSSSSSKFFTRFIEDLSGEGYPEAMVHTHTLNWLNKADKEGFPQASLLISFWKSNSSEEKLLFLKQSADRECGEALSILGNMYIEGKNVEKNFKTGIEYLRKAAKGSLKFSRDLARVLVTHSENESKFFLMEGLDISCALHKIHSYSIYSIFKNRRIFDDKYRSKLARLILNNSLPGNIPLALRDLEETVEGNSADPDDLKFLADLYTKDGAYLYTEDGSKSFVKKDEKRAAEYYNRHKILMERRKKLEQSWRAEVIPDNQEKVVASQVDKKSEANSQVEKHT